MHPLLGEILERLTRANSGGGERLVLLSGHDTVVAQLLAAIGGMADGRHCRWPPYEPEPEPEPVPEPEPEPEPYFYP